MELKTDRDKQFGTQARPWGDREAKEMVCIRGVNKVRCKSDDGFKLVTEEERRAIKQAIAAAHKDPQGWSPDIVFPKFIAWASVKAPIHEPTWGVQYTDGSGKSIGGRIDWLPAKAAVKEEPVNVVRQRQIHYHNLPDKIINHSMKW